MGTVWKFVIMTMLTHIVEMWFDRGENGKEEMRGIMYEFMELIKLINV